MVLTAMGMLQSAKARERKREFIYFSLEMNFGKSGIHKNTSRLGSERLYKMCVAVEGSLPLENLNQTKATTFVNTYPERI